jgi:hypothetical protein
MGVHSKSIGEVKSSFLKVRYLHFVWFYLAAEFTHVDVVCLRNVGISLVILEEYGVFIHIKWLDF